MILWLTTLILVGMVAPQPLASPNYYAISHLPMGPSSLASSDSRLVGCAIEQILLNFSWCCSFCIEGNLPLGP